ncbi:MAG: hypothetical protein B6244_00010 [Candidatus Cloacimonetes bacterium 4572_55]|nr:MAG: hypothetical protein B6244_00010 [Candidatus Cloacimonetes bacterium 4572_55]
MKNRIFLFGLLLLIHLSTHASVYGVDFETLTSFVTSGPHETFLERATSFGDINGDTHTDALLMTRNLRDGEFNLHIFYGRRSWDAEVSTDNSDVIIRMTREASFNNIWARGDIDDDGKADFLFNSDTEVFIFYGGALKRDMTPNDADILIQSREPILITSVISGDVNNDGFDDIIIGAKKENIGFVYIFYNEILTPYIDVSKADLIIEGEEPNDSFGKSLRVLSDMTSDKRNELLIGAPKAFESGAVYLFYRPYQTGEIYAETADVIFFGNENVREKFGYTIEDGGDLNGDGTHDIVIGAQKAKGLDSDMGAVYIYHGKDFWESVEIDQADAIVTGDKGGDLFGKGFAPISDVTEDGKGELVVGSEWSVSENDPTGRIYFFNGEQLISKMDAITAEKKLTGISNEVRYNGIVQPAGDFDNDKKNDFFVMSQELHQSENLQVLKVMTIR